MYETIERAAVILDGEVWQLPRPARHHHILWAIDQVTGRGIEGIPANQGFVTSTGRFVGREDAARIAVLAGQVIEPQYGRELYSEDLW